MGISDPRNTMGLGHISVTPLARLVGGRCIKIRSSDVNQVFACEPRYLLCYSLQASG
jgi:hypothetical protein